MDNTNTQKTHKSRKKAALIFIIVVLAIGLISLGALAILSVLDKDEDKGPTNKYSDELHSYIFYTPDYDLDVTTVEEYMALDRMLYYKDGGQEFGIAGNAGDFGAPVVFFEKYFETVIAGDWEAYNEMFTDHYYESNEPETQFAPQMIYDMHIEKLQEVIEEGKETYVFDVSYRIYRNDGTFRNDLGEGAAKKLQFRLTGDGDDLKIDYIGYYKTPDLK